MNRETKLALILGLAVFLIVGVFMGEHYSSIRQPVLNIDVGIGGSGDLADAPSLSPNNPLLPERVLDVPKPVTVAQSGTPAASAGAGGERAAGTNQRPPGGPAMIENGKRGIAFSPTPLTTTPDTRQLPGGMDDASRTQDNPLKVQNPLTPGGPAGSGAVPTAGSGLPISTGKEIAYTVKAGDNGAKIAKSQYNDSELWTKLREYNKAKIGKNDGLSIGTTLRIPPKDVLLGKAELSPAGRGVNPPVAASGVAGSGVPAVVDGTTNLVTGPAAAGAKPPSEKPIDPNGPKLYTVKSGDTLMTIAKTELGSSNRWKEILDLNKRTLAAPENLQLGMQLKIPAKDSAKDRAPSGTVR